MKTNSNHYLYVYAPDIPPIVTDIILIANFLSSKFGPQKLTVKV